MTNILIVSCYSVDINNSASIELIYYINLLAESGEFNVHLLTMNFPENSIYYDSEISKFVHKNVFIHRVEGSFFLNKLLPKKIALKNENVRTCKYNSILIKIKNFITPIDPYISWVNNAVKYFKENFKNINFDVILGMHEPPSSLICSYKIKDFVSRHNPNVKLVSYFSDPYCNEVSRRNKNIFVRNLNKSIERIIIDKSDKFLFVTKNNCEYYRGKYGINLNDTGIIHRSFDKKFYDINKGEYPIEFSKHKINFLHAGDIVKNVRDISEFINAISYLHKNYIDVFEKLNLNFYGNINDDVQKNLINDKNYINFKSRIPYSEAINFMIHSDVLIVFGNKKFDQIPAKIYDYLGTNSYILVILESYSDPLYDLVKNIDGLICVLNNCGDIVKAILKFVKEFNYDREFDRNKFDSKETFSKLNKILISD